tara:strand:+ start:383 stop:2221 length:1839 start_codon:yes stop_codon:yes gene_type:complete
MSSKTSTEHSFHIPVMGTSFTIDSPLKVAKFGISSVVSIVDDELCENMRKHYSELYGYDYEEIKKFDDDYRARRITGYLNLLDKILNNQFQSMREMSFDEESNDLNKYFQMLPDDSNLKLLYDSMCQTDDQVEKNRLADTLKNEMKPGAIDVNIMTKIDRNNFDKEGNLLPQEYSDALAALRGYAMSNLDSGIVLSAGFNRRLYAYFEQFKDFYPDETGYIKKKIILKVSDFRSSLTQTKFLSKKGLWISEHRIESGLNCGGHAFATEGYLLGPILEEFKQNRKDLISSSYVMCNQVLKEKGKPFFKTIPTLKVTVQGGIGTAKENAFLFDFYKIDNTGWASPFLLVPEATVLDDQTRMMLLKAKREDFYLSRISPLGVPFNTVRNTVSEQEKLKKYYAGRPGSACPKGHLISNTEFSKKQVCTASIFFQKRKIKELESLNLSKDALEKAIMKVINKACLCEDLAASALINNKIENKRVHHSAVCPGPNLSYFSRISSLKDMISHIYGRISLLNDTYRPNMFISELQMYVKYFKEEVTKTISEEVTKREKYLFNFQKNLFEGIHYYANLIPNLLDESSKYKETMVDELKKCEQELEQFIAKHKQLFSQFAVA